MHQAVNIEQVPSKSAMLQMSKDSTMSALQCSKWWIHSCVLPYKINLKTEVQRGGKESEFTFFPVSL
jgi:hypothetical protein